MVKPGNKRIMLAMWLLLLVALVGTSIAGPFEDGLEAYNRGDYDEAIRLYRKAVKQGDATAQYPSAPCTTSAGAFLRTTPWRTSGITSQLSKVTPLPSSILAQCTTTAKAYRRITSRRTCGLTLLLPDSRHQRQRTAPVPCSIVTVSPLR